MKLWWQSSYDRGLDVLLFMWPDVVAKYPDATLDICYGWQTFDAITAGNPERQQWKANVTRLMNQPGITHHGRIGKDEMKKLRSKCDIWAYPTYFEEIDCITAKECQADGLVPVTMAFGALTETAKNGILIDGDIMRVETANKFKDALLTLMGDKKLYKRLKAKCQKYALKQTWVNMAKRWDLEPVMPTQKITVYTPTIREGFWNLMADNLSKQTYKNFEWLIVDDHKDNRQEIAEKYAKQYELDIRYIRGVKRRKSKYTLVQANNTAMQNATGELFVALQDFILLQPTALEELARESERHPGDLIAPVDVYYKPNIKPNINNREDWFDGKTNIIGEFMRKNIRIQNAGFRKTDNPYDFEMNIGAIPMSTLRELGGWWEFMDDGLGYDNTEIALRAMQLGHKVWIDEWNIAVCIDHWGVVGSQEGGVNRTRMLNDPRYYYIVTQTENGKLPVKRTQKIDDSITLSYEIPEKVSDEECKTWIRENYKKVAEKWT